MSNIDMHKESPQVEVNKIPETSRHPDIQQVGNRDGDLARHYFESYLPNQKPTMADSVKKALKTVAQSSFLPLGIPPQMVGKVVNSAEVGMINYTLETPGTIDSFSSFVKTENFQKLVMHWSEVSDDVVDKTKLSITNYMKNEFGITLPKDFKLTRVNIVLPESKGVKPITGFWIDGTNHFIGKDIGYINRPVSDMGTYYDGIVTFFPPQKINGKQVASTPIDREKLNRADILREMTFKTIEYGVPIKTITPETTDHEAKSAYQIEFKNGKKYTVILTGIAIANDATPHERKYDISIINPSDKKTYLFHGATMDTLGTILKLG